MRAAGYTAYTSVANVLHLNTLDAPNTYNIPKLELKYSIIYRHNIDDDVLSRISTSSGPHTIKALIF